MSIEEISAKFVGTRRTSAKYGNRGTSTKSEEIRWNSMKFHENRRKPTNFEEKRDKKPKSITAFENGDFTELKVYKKHE